MKRLESTFKKWMCFLHSKKNKSKGVFKHERKTNKNNVYDLSFFMPGQTTEAEEVKSIISKRFVDKEGKVIPFVFKAITTERIDELEKENTTFKNVKGRGRVKDLDSQRFFTYIAVESTIYPDFKSKELREAYGTQDPVEVAKRVLSVGGEYANWLNKAIEVNGFEDEIEDLETEAKN
ncbi:phage-like element PBSX protein XkdN [Bacillus safensis]|uniref:Phage-like element PBSX protein XkdN n=1 Tax=Bacillus safensis TaxID=561879 RepID=A0A5S9MBN5_BACIA|nr:phage-like element PBSX protein XkdN [Bacillus safensis]